MAKRKFKFVEMFIDPETGAPFEGLDSPKVIKTENFGTFTGHQIARIVYEKRQMKEKKVTIQNGKTVESGTQTVTVMFEKMGEKGGWLESTNNLSQDGECWVSDGGIVCGNGFVCDDVKLSSGEVGENAKVGGEAKISGKVGIGGSAYVFGKAKIDGGSRVAGVKTCLADTVIVSHTAKIGLGAVVHSLCQKFICLADGLGDGPLSVSECCAVIRGSCGIVHCEGCKAYSQGKSCGVFKQTHRHSCGGFVDYIKLFEV